MALRWKAYAPNTILKAVEVQDLADNGVIQLDTAADLASADLVNANVVYVVAEAKPYVRQAAGVGADKWQVFSGGLSGLGGWADITATTGSPTKLEYTDAAGNDWTAYEFTGDGTVTAVNGLADVLVVGAGATTNNNTPAAGGGVSTGLLELQGTFVAQIGAVFGPNGYGTQSFLYDQGSDNVLSSSQGGPYSGTGAGGHPTQWSGVYSNVKNGTSTEYGVGWSPGQPTPPLEFGNANNLGNTGRPAGVVIIRVPRANAKA